MYEAKEIIKNMIAEEKVTICKTMVIKVRDENDWGFNTCDRRCSSCSYLVSGLEEIKKVLLMPSKELEPNKLQEIRTILDDIFWKFTSKTSTKKIELSGFLSDEERVKVKAELEEIIRKRDIFNDYYDSFRLNVDNDEDSVLINGFLELIS